MKKLDLPPTEENLLQTLYSDSIGRNKDLVSFYSLLQSLESMSAIALDGRWGSGKTFFVGQAKMIINSLNPSSDMEDEMRNNIKKVLPFDQKEQILTNADMAVYYDAWSNDNDEDPVISLVYEITRQLSLDFSLADAKVVKAVGSIIEFFSGRKVNGIIEALSSDDPFSKFKKQKDIETKINEFFEGIFAERGNRLIIFIDELDRCKPIFAVHLLEQIKHYMTDDRLLFIFSVNLEQLQYTIKHYYGDDFDSCRYLNRFFDLTITLPQADMDKFYKQIGLGHFYFDEQIINRVIDMFHFELRDIAKFYAQVKTAVYATTHSRKESGSCFPSDIGEMVILKSIVPLIIGLKMADVSKYDDFISGKDSAPLHEVLTIENTYLIGILTSEEETLKNEKITVTTKMIIDRLYDAIFVNKYEDREYCTSLGKCEFTKGSKFFAINAASLMSSYTDLS